MMDSLLRACFAPPVQEQPDSPTAAHPTPDTEAVGSAEAAAQPEEQAALRTAHGCEARMVRAHMSACAKRLAAKAREALSRLLADMQGSQPGGQEADSQHDSAAEAETEGMRALEASARLEAADEHLSRIRQAGFAGGEDASLLEDEDWLDEEAQLQSSQHPGTGQSMSATVSEESLVSPAKARSDGGPGSKQQDRQLQSLLDFDEGPEQEALTSLQPQDAEANQQMYEPEENTLQPLPSFFGQEDEEDMLLDGLLEDTVEGSGAELSDSFEPEAQSGHSGVAAQRSEASALHQEEELPAFFQLDDSSKLTEALELEPEAFVIDLGIGEGSEMVALQEERAQLADLSGKLQPDTVSPAGLSSSPGHQQQPEQEITAYGRGQQPHAGPAAALAHKTARQESGILRPVLPTAALEHRLMQPASQTGPPERIYRDVMRHSSTQASAADAGASQTSSHSACGGTRVEESPESQSALKAMQEAVWAVGKSASLQVQLEALSGALKQAGEAQRAKSRAISQYEWMHEAVLGAAGLLGPPIQLTQQVHTASAKPPVLTGYI